MVEGWQGDRRAFLRLTGDLALLAAFPAHALAELLAQYREEGHGVFLSAGQMRTLRALCAHFVPGPPEDSDPGALEAGAAEYIDLLLGAFQLPRPRIFAGGPFSNRQGGGRNEFAEFLALDALEERVWRTRIEGSRGLPEREWNGRVKGLQEIYSEGLDAVERASRRFFRREFARLPASLRPIALEWLPGGPDEAFLVLAQQHCFEGTYGAPEYGGNLGSVGWSYTHWPGDHQPQGYTGAQISEPDPDQREAAQRALQRGRARAAPKPPDA